LISVVGEPADVAHSRKREQCGGQGFLARESSTGFARSFLDAFGAFCSVLADANFLQDARLFFYNGFLTVSFCLDGALAESVVTGTDGTVNRVTFDADMPLTQGHVLLDRALMDVAANAYATTVLDTLADADVLFNYRDGLLCGTCRGAARAFGGSYGPGRRLPSRRCGGALRGPASGAPLLQLRVEVDRLEFFQGADDSLTVLGADPYCEDGMPAPHSFLVAVGFFLRHKQAANRIPHALVAGAGSSGRFVSIQLVNIGDWNAFFDQAITGGTCAL
jgi:hypothetical protein